MLGRVDSVGSKTERGESVKGRLEVDKYWEDSLLTFYHAEVTDLLWYLLKTRGAGSIDYVLTSPPYFCQIDYENEFQLGIEKQMTAYLWRMVGVFRLIRHLLKPGGVCWIVLGDTSNNYSPVRSKSQRRKLGKYLFRRPLQSGFLEKEPLRVHEGLITGMREDGWVHRNTLIWDKGTSSQLPNSDTAALTHEHVIQVVKWDGRDRPYANCSPLSRSVLQHKTTSDPIHPCPYPVSLAREILSTCRPGGLVLDPFLGSGTTAIACQELNLRCIGGELNEAYLERAVSRCGQLSLCL